MAISFAGQVVIVTGATSGIGEATALAYKRAGAQVVGTGRRAEAVEGARGRHPQLAWVLADVTDVEHAARAVEAALRLGNRLDVLVNNAGIFARAPLESATPEVERTLFTTNVFGVTNMSRAALPHIIQTRGSILNVSSAAAHRAAPGIAHYAATKAALESLTRSWAKELAPAGVRVNCIAPGPVATEVLLKSGVAPEHLASAQQQLARSLPLGRIAQPEEIAHFIVTLTDPSATWVTGQILGVDGGMGLG